MINFKIKYCKKYLDNYKIMKSVKKQIKNTYI